jgi:hypothetical protein
MKSFALLLILLIMTTVGVSVVGVLFELFLSIGD